MFSTALIDKAHASALDRWNHPFPGFASGKDPRTSDPALLGLTYGNLVHAARFEWHNAGRRLIDKTYIDILWQVQGLTGLRTVRAEQVSAALDGFITDIIRPGWQELPLMSHEERCETATVWVEQMAGRCFGSLYSELAASRVMFYLLPMLPVFNLSGGHLSTLERLGQPPATNTYRDYAGAAETAYRQHRTTLRQYPFPPASSGDAAVDATAETVLGETDWWYRRVFDEMLRITARTQGDNGSDPFGCDDAGMPNIQRPGPGLPTRR